MFLAATAAQAQITIGGNVYGGGNEGNTDGNTKVTVRAGDINAVFGGARKADVGGNAFVNIDGKYASNYIIINKVYGGNDISGEIGKGNSEQQENTVKTLPTELEKATENSVTKDWDAFVRVSTKTDTDGKETSGAQKIYIGQLFGGGNGDYDYTSDDYQGLTNPVLGKTYLEIVGGSIVYAYGGGNNATVTENTVICVDNPSKVVNSILDKDNHELLTNDRFKNQMGINIGFSYPSSDAFQIGRFFGGNNKAEMAIRPTWYLKSGKIRNLYSGGNQGDMTSPEGLLLNIDADSKIIVDNLFGGCRMADVKPMENGVLTTTENLAGYNFPRGFSARVVISGGDINNVYGGNDISGKVYGGNAVGIRTSVRGDVYGGGNGSYPYTDQVDLKSDDIYGDLYYGDFLNDGINDERFTTSVEALNAFRPNADQVSIRVVGTQNKPTIVHGSIYCGGNSATIMSTGDNPTVELKIGSYVIADNVYLGNNGANMVTEDILKHYAYSVDADGKVVTSGGTDFSSLNLTDKTTFQTYMDGVAMTLKPSVVFDRKANGDAADYKDYSSYFGSFFCGGNVGSMKTNGKITINFNKPVYIYDKVVGGCNDANIYAQTGLNAEYLGGLLGDPDPVPAGSPEGTIGNKLELNFAGLKIQPKRWKYQRDDEYNIKKDEDGNALYELDDYGNAQLEWNTISASTGKDVAPVTESKAFEKATDLDRRLKGGNIYGGCYNRGHINGNIIINLNASIHERDKLFDVVANEGETLYENVENAEKEDNYYTITKRNTGVILSHQGMDVLGAALNVFGGGYGGDSEIWGSTTINLNAGYTFQIFGGGEAGAIGQAKSSEPDPNNPSAAILEYVYDQNYSTYINLNGDPTLPGVARGADGDSPDMAECEFIYGGGFEGKIAGNTHVNLGNGRIFNSFAGSCNADILGHTETYVGLNGFPWVRDHIYGGNDLGGKIERNVKEVGEATFASRIRDEVKSMVAKNYDVASYMEYTQGRVRNILGGCFGDYDYTDEAYSSRIANKPYLRNTFVNFRPNTHVNNSVEKVFGAGEGYPGDRDGDKGQDHSYVLIDIPDGVENFANTEVFGAGAYNGLGMRYPAADTFPGSETSIDINEASAIIDLMRGKIGAAYGGSYEEGVTRRTMVNVPDGSTIKIGSIFGGAYGSSAYNPCDVYEANVNWLTKSEDAYLISNNTDLTKGFIYGGNNNARRTLYSKVNISAPVRQKHYKYGMTTGTVYGAGCGRLTWNEYTEVNLNEGAKVYEVYGGAEAGSVMSAESVQAYYNMNREGIDADAWKAAWSLGSGYDPESFSTGYVNNHYTNLENPLVRKAEMDDRDTKTYKYNTNVIIHKGAYVGNYAYGGGLGKEGQSFVGSGDVYGTTYIALLGGIVNKDIYAAGTSGAVYNVFGAENLTASANAFIAGGSVRNVYGGGWKGDVGYTTMTVSADGKTATFDATNEKPGETHVVIGIRPDQTDDNLVAELKKVTGKNNATKSDYGFYAGLPAIQRNAYGGGEGGAVYGSSYLTINNGYIGYVHLNADEVQNEQGEIVTTTETTKERYEEKIHDDTYYVDDVWKGKDRLADCGNLFGGGYDVKSSVDFSHITMWNGLVRNSLVGGGEIATIGRGAIDASGPSNSIRTLRGIYKAGKTNIEMFNGHVLRNVFGGGKGYNTFGYGQQGTLYMDGYIFGQTEVHIHGGEIGTDDGLAEGYGNVFGGGDIGFVYSPSINSTKTKADKAAGKTTGSPGHYYYYDDSGNLTEDCKVVVSPYLQVKSGSVNYDNKTYGLFDYVPTDYLNTLPKKNDAGNWSGGWENLITGDSQGEEERGIYIHNAIFAGGNVSSNNDQTYANATTIYGNTTATLYDVYHRDFITIGTEHTGGIYGGGNLSVVDGYRELNITNYGTDYYGLKQTISIDEYRGLSNRERAYFQLEYKCKNDVTINGVEYKKDQRLTEEEYLKLLSNEDIANQVKASFEPYGFCSIYAGRLLNTIQRADLCGVFGSRMVLQGSKDRVAEVGEDIDYTINRVGELSLNQQHSVRTGTGFSNPDSGSDATHGNYFGIYSLVNYLGNLTSDVKFGSDYVNGDGTTSTDGTTYYSYKSSKHTSSDRNKGQSANQVALASGVFLELTTENSTKDKKDYGYVTGVVELDLINVKKDLVGGGFVYAKNEHRVPKYYPKKSNVLLSEYNKPKSEGGKQPDEARTYKRYQYSLDQSGDWSESEGSYVISGDNSHVYKTMEWQTSGNFIHPSKRIVDDCYPTNNAYIISSANYSEAHYWYVKGEVYIYEQKVSAYTGSANAYSKEVHLPLTITAASNGKLQLLNVKPNLYAYYTNNNGTRVKIGTNDAQGKPIDKVTVNNESDSYGLNDVISWWDWHQMSASDRQYFVTETYVNCVKCTIDGVEYEQGTYVMDQTDYEAFIAGTHDIRNSNGDHFKDDNNNDIGKTYVFRSSNNISHETGYLLTFDMDTPKAWDDYYTRTQNSSTETNKITKAEYEALFTNDMSDADKQAIINAWREGPTFTPTETGVYGKRTYKAGEVVTKAVHDNAGVGQDNMEEAYVATESVTYTYNNTTKTVNSGTAISNTEHEALKNTSAYNSFAAAWFCTYSLKLTNENYLLYGELKTADEIAAMKAIEGKLVTNDEIDAALTPAYICTQDGEYGGQRFETGKNYSAIQAWSSLPVADREKFSYNYDALDLLVKSSYLTVDPDITTSPTHESTVGAFHAPYTDQMDVEYQAVYTDETTRTIKYNDGTSKSFTKDTQGATIMNTEFETIRNDKRHYTYIETKNNGDDVYIANKNFIYLGTPYGCGQVVDADTYNANENDVDLVQITTAGEWYYCYEDYVDKNNQSVNKGKLITKEEYGNVPNDQKYFIIQGQEPTETTTLYVSRESNAYDVMKEKIVTVVYQYTYYEDEDDGSVKLTNELHVINIHLDLQSGVPQIGQLSPPATVLPGNIVGLTAPDVNPGLYEVISNGWELYSTPDDADNHRNGVPFENNNTPVYWYQNGNNYIAFYSKTYLGKTYSNPVPLSVANYHDLDKVMNDKEHHLYVDKSNVERPCKIYIDNRDCESDPAKSELDLLKDFFDLSVNSGSPAVAGHSALDSHVRAGRNLEFFLGSDVSPKKYTTWTPIGNNSTTGDNGQCFGGNLHGDGHTISGLSSSLFNHLCGEVYNLGVTGSFTGAGIAEAGDGYVENCWVKTSATTAPETKVKSVYGNPERNNDTTRGDVQVVNCYYSSDNEAIFSNTTDATHGNAKMMPAEAFYNGTVAYDLNGFYLHKRYYQGTNLSSGTAYRYLKPNADGTLPEEMSTGYYPNDYAIYQPDVKVAEGESVPYLSYVENRFYDGDYRYAGGSIPDGTDIRMRTITEGEGDNAVTTTYYVPIWPDDYLFFGQSLTFDYGSAHQSVPSAIKKSDGRLVAGTGSNRVYRAPAYFGSATMGVAHFNPVAILAASSNPEAGTPVVEAYPGMTAIDFTGGNGDLSGGYQFGLKGVTTKGEYVEPTAETAVSTRFYPPLLDDDGLTSINNVDETKNLLVYTTTIPSSTTTNPTAAEKTADVVGAYLQEPAFAETNATYRSVAVQSTDIIKGHHVQLSSGNYLTSVDHLLVDKQDFNCPIAYTMGSGKRMLYQRKPDNFVTLESGDTKGWDGICLPFSPELVSTQDKGEITHFYSTSTTGHEYWLREFTDIDNYTDGATELPAIFTLPAADENEEDKEFKNSFLYDYYYSNNSFNDANSDIYQKDYYIFKEDKGYVQKYNNYPLQKAGKPYLVGFPGKSYYEFDLSGSFEATTAATTYPAQLNKQSISFVSTTGATIGVSDDELKGDKVTKGDYDYLYSPTYTTKELPIGHFMLSNDGSKYEILTAAAKALPFRPYFVKGPKGSLTRGQGGTLGADPLRSIIFSGDMAQMKVPKEINQLGGDDDLIVTAGKKKICVESQLRYTTDVRIVTPAGVTLATYSIQSSEYVETQVYSAGVYIVYADNGKYVKKVIVK